MRENKIDWKLILFLIAIVLAGCSKSEVTRYETFALGRRVSADKSDTLDFVKGKDFYKSDGHFHHEHYDYQIMGDSIQIGYRGTLMILVRPTRHRFSVIDGNLTIDFTNTTCYGFSREIMTYRKEP